KGPVMNSCLPGTPAIVHGALDGLKKRNSGHKSITNYFLQQLDGVANLRMLESKKSLCFSHDEWDFSRLYFYTFDPEDLVQVLQRINWPPIVVTDWIAKGDTSTVDEFLGK